MNRIMRREYGLLRRIRRVQSKIARESPHRSIGLEGNPGASRQGILLTEQRLGRPLPPSYRHFLLESDGWSRFYSGVNLLGTADLGCLGAEDSARASLMCAGM
ncbi:MAG TPA: SMI1/KNR4 family protein, partial [Polyangiaceae bacterium]